MKICHLTMHFFPKIGGQEAYIYDLNNILNKNGYETIVIQPRRGDLYEDNNIVFLRPARYLNRFIEGWDWIWFNIMLYVNKNSLFKDGNTYISHYPFHYLAVPKKNNVIVVSHGVDWPHKSRTAFDFLKKYATKKLLQNKVKIVANDTNFLRILGLKIENGSEYFNEVADNIWFIPNCVDTDKYNYVNQVREEIILVPRNIRKSRGIDLAIDAFNLFLDKNKNFKMIIAGGPLNTDYHKFCLAKIKNLGIEQSVEFIGSVGASELIDLYHKAKITLVPTRDYEGTSLSALESMSCGTPVVSTKIGGLLDLPTCKSEMTPIDICRQLHYVNDNWLQESESQYSQTVKTFNLINWKQKWLEVIEK